MTRAKIPRKTFDRSAYATEAAEPAEGETRSIRGEESWYLGPNNRAGSLITPDTGATIASAYACIIRLASDIGAMPFNVKRRAKDGSSRIDWDAPGQDLLNNGPNDKMTSQSWIESGMWHCLTHGNAYSRGRYDGLMEFESFDLLDPAMVQPAETKSGELYYRVAGESVPAAEVLHVRAPGYNGINGKSPIRQCAESMGLTMAVEGFGSDFFSNGIRPSGIISFDEDPDEESVKEIRKTVEAEHAGPGRKARIMTLTAGAKWNPTSIKPEEAQFLLTRGYQLRECCRIFSVPGPKVQDFSETSFASLEELNLDYYQSSLLPWLTRFEKEWLRKLFPLARQRKLYTIEHDRNHLLKGRMIDQANVFKILKEIGVMNGNQIAAHYGLPSHDGGQYFTIQLNQGNDKAIGEATLEQLKGIKPTPAKTADESSDADTSTRSTKILPSPAMVDAALDALAA